MKQLQDAQISNLLSTITDDKDRFVAPRGGVKAVGGMFAADEPNDPKGRPAPVQLNSERVFYVTEGDHAGGLRHDWRRWRYAYADGGMVGVEVIWTEDDRITLTGKDAYNFLRLVQDRNYHYFSRAPRNPMQA